MATLTLYKVWINLVSSGEGISGWAAPSRPETVEAAGDVRRYAGGRDRVIRLRGVRRAKSFAMRIMPTEDKETLVGIPGVSEGWVGRHVQVRDRWGRWYGTFLGADVNPRKDGTWDIAFTLTAVTTADTSFDAIDAPSTLISGGDDLLEDTL